jgi:N-acetylglucosamine-6-sulfatase
MILGACLAVGVVPFSLPAGAVGGSGARTALAGAADRPNVVLITADDMRADDLVFMPRTQALLQRAGVQFTDAISPYPLCCPARASLLTGQYAHNHQVAGNEYPWGGNRRFVEVGGDEETLPVWLRRSGYTTAFLGKYLNYYGSMDGYQGTPGGAAYIPPGWNVWKGASQPVFNYDCVVVNENGRRVRHRAYQTDLFADMTERLIPRLARGDRPFFIWQSQMAPHQDLSPPGRTCGTATSGPLRVVQGPPPAAPRHEGMFDGLPLPYVPSANEADMSDKATRVRAAPVDMSVQRRLYEGRAEALQALDEAVAGTVATLRAHGVLDETVIIFTSDNGWMFGEHRQTGKVVPYEESLRVPLLVRGPGFGAGQVRAQPVGIPDIPATVVELADASPHVRLPVAGDPGNTEMDGVSLSALAHDPGLLDERVIPIEAGLQYGSDGLTPRWMYQGVRSPRHTYIAWQMRRRSTQEDFPVEEEFYDRVVDPYQLDSTHRRSSADLDRLRTVYQELRDCVGVACVREVS